MKCFSIWASNNLYSLIDFLISSHLDDKNKYKIKLKLNVIISLWKLILMVTKDLTTGIQWTPSGDSTVTVNYWFSFFKRPQEQWECNNSTYRGASGEVLCWSNSNTLEIDEHVIFT